MLGAPRTDPYVKNYLIRLLPRVMTIIAPAGSPPCDARRPRNPMPRFPGPVSGASKVRSTFPLVGPLSSTDSAAAFRPALFARFFGTMRPSDSLETCMSDVRQCLLGPSPALRRGNFQGLPISVQRVSTHAQGLRLRGVHERLAISVVHDVAFPLSGQGRHTEDLISELNGWPACAPVNASPAMLPPPAHDSGLERFATPFPCDSFIRYSSPAFIGAFPDPPTTLPKDI